MGTITATVTIDAEGFFEEAIKDVTSVVEEARQSLESILFRFEGDEHPLSTLRRLDPDIARVHRNTTAIHRALSDFDPTATKVRF